MLPPDGRPEILALRALKLGDLLVAVPALHALRRTFPEHRLIFAGPPWLRPVVGLVGGIDEHLPTPGLDGPLSLPACRVDIAVNLHGNGTDSRGVLEALAPGRRIGHRAPGWSGPEWQDGVHERHRWARLMEEHGIAADPLDLRIEVPAAPSPVAGASVVHVGAFYGSRQWPAERFAAVARSLAEDGRQVVLTGSAKERARALEVAGLAGLPEQQVLAGELELDEFAAVIAGARILVSADTGAAHLASAYGTPSVVLFGPAPVEEWGPPEGPHIVLTDGALRRGDTFSAEPDPALLAVSVADVLAAVASLS
jgi:ADP-heptose:LPS heptosyltransferase